jgi:hypothetical protein
MRVRDALEQLDHIHEHLSRAGVYRGFRAPAVALVGALGLLAAAGQPLVPGAAAGTGFATYWAAVAGAGCLVGLAASARSCALDPDELERRRTRRVLAQFLPCLLAGAAITAGLVRTAPELVPLLPGIWAVVFGLGVVAASPHLPAGVWSVGTGYVAVGAAILLRTDPSSGPSGWAVGGVFGAGHLATALVLWRDAETNDDA